MRKTPYLLVLLLSLTIPFWVNASHKIESLPKEVDIPSQQQTVYFEGTVVVDAYFTSREMVDAVAEKSEPWHVDYNKSFLTIDVDFEGYLALQEAGFVIIINDEETTKLNEFRLPLLNQGGGIPGYACYRTVEETFSTAEDLAATYPTLAEWVDVGDSWEKTQGLGGYDMMVLRITNQEIDMPKPTLFATSAIHAREYATAELTTRFAEYLLQNYGTDPDVTWLVDYHEIHLMLHANPDGRKQAETGILWRKNTNQNYCGAGSNSRGVDLNRNFDFQWGCCNGSSTDECNDTFRGPSGGSEPEVQSIQNYLSQIFPDQRDDPMTSAAPITSTGVYLDIHSFSELVLWPWGGVNVPAPNGTELQTLGRRLAYFNEYTPEQSIGLYPTDGTTLDYGYGELGVPSFVYELGTSFFQDCGTFENTILPDNLPSLIYAAKTARTPYITPAGPEALDLSLSAVVVEAGTDVILTASINDTRFNNSEGTEPIQPIASAEFYINTPPWMTTTTPIANPMVAVDGTFDTSVEAVTGVIDTTGWDVGRHIIFVHGEDTTNTWGAMSAIFLYVVDPAVAPVLAGEVTAADSGLPLEAQIQAGNTFITTSDAQTGLYQMNVISGTYDVTASADGYASMTVTGLTIADAQTVVQDFSLYPYCDIFFDDMESGSGDWNAQSPWTISTEEAHSPANAWTDSPGGDYGNNRNVAITSPEFDLTDYSGVGLNYWQMCNTESGYDYCIVEYSTNGGSTWQQAASFDGDGNDWEEFDINMDALAGVSNARFRFRLTSDVTVTRDGWHVDDVRLYGAGPTCVTNNAPTAGFDADSMVEVGTAVSFLNTSSGSGLTFTWDFGDGSATVTDPNPSHTFTDVGAYTVTLTATNNTGSDSISQMVEVLQAPDAVFAPSSSSVMVGDSVTFNNTSTGTDLSYLWDFGDGSATVTDPAPTHTYNQTGTFTVTLTVSNGLGSDDFTQTVDVTEDVVGTEYHLFLPFVKQPE